MTAYYVNSAGVGLLLSTSACSHRTEKRKITMLWILVVVLCGVQFVLGLLVIVSIALVLSSTGQRCLLYADESRYGSQSWCNYTIAAASVCQLVLCLARGVFVVLAGKGVLNHRYLKNKMFLISCTVGDIISCVMTLVSGGIISHGFYVMCSSVFQPHPDKCGEFDIYDSASNSFLKHYYQRLKIAEIGGWLGWLFFLLLTLLDLLLLRKASLLSFPPPLSSSSSSPSPSSASSSHFLFSRGCCQTGSDVSDAYDEAPEEDEDPEQSAATRYNFSATRFHARTGSDSSGPPRTPPPTRPVPARPVYTPAGEVIRY